MEILITLSCPEIQIAVNEYLLRRGFLSKFINIKALTEEGLKIKVDRIISNSTDYSKYRIP